MNIPETTRCPRRQSTLQLIIMTEPLIKDYTMELVERACEPGSFEYKIELTLAYDISEALPYINAEVNCIDYLHGENFLSFNHNDIFCSMRPNLITIAMARSREEALQMIDTIVELLNNIWGRRDNIEPKYSGRKQKPPTLSVYKLLPRTNCGQCGLPTCMGFVSALINDQTQVDECPYLSQNDYLQQRNALLSLLGL